MESQSQKLSKRFSNVGIIWGKSKVTYSPRDVTAKAMDMQEFAVFKTLLRDDFLEMLLTLIARIHSDVCSCSIDSRVIWYTCSSQLGREDVKKAQNTQNYYIMW